MINYNIGEQKGNIFGTEKLKNICSDDYTGHFQLHHFTIPTLAPLESIHPSKHNKTNYNNKHSETRHSVIILNKKAVRSKCISKKKKTTYIKHLDYSDEDKTLMG